VEFEPVTLGTQGTKLIPEPPHPKRGKSLKTLLHQSRYDWYWRVKGWFTI